MDGFGWLALHHHTGNAGHTGPKTHQSCKMKTKAQRVDVLECLVLVARSKQFVATSAREGGRVHPLDWAQPKQPRAPTHSTDCPSL